MHRKTRCVCSLWYSAPGLKTSYHLHFCSILGLSFMPPPPCQLCGNKWFIVGGGLCQVCRSVDRLAAIARGPEIPATAEQEVLSRLRSWICSLQDLGELFRGVAPNPVQALLPRGTGGAPPREGGSAATAPPPQGTGGAPPREGGSAATAPPPGPEAPATTAKAPPLPPPPPPPVPAVESGVASGSKAAPPLDSRVEEEGPPEGERKESAKSSKKAKKRKSSPSSSARQRKRSRRSRSGRSRSLRRSRRLASPVRAPGVKTERSESEDPADRRERKSRPLFPRSPSRPPLPADRGDRAHPTRRPEGRYWQGPIRAPRWEPPPGQGIHFGKNKGQTKRDKRANYQRGRNQGRRR